ncbi:MAG: lipocalin-like domain-containing protein [Gemmatimonadaceae bacterium]
MQAPRILGVLSLVAIAACATAGNSGGRVPLNTSNVAVSAVGRRALVGVWRVVQFCNVDSTGKETNPLGATPVGVFVYTPAGQLSLHAMRTTGVPPFVAGDDAPTDAERRALLDGYFGYFGTYTITSDSTVIHHVAGGSIPSYIGTDQHRHYRIRAGGSNAPDTLSIGTYPAPRCRKLLRVG